MAADHLFELGLDRDEIYARAVELEGHPDNVGAALYGGFVLCPQALDGARPPPVRLEPPQGVEGVLVVPDDEVPTERAREAMPADVPVDDAVANLAAASQLVLGVERSDLTLIERGLADRLHQPHRAHLYPRSMELLAQARGARGDRGDRLRSRARAPRSGASGRTPARSPRRFASASRGWAEVRRAPFSPLGADVPEL